jgi:hypothetical protein
LDSSFIERFGIWGMAGMLGLMAVMGVYGFVSLIGVDPQEALLPPAQEEAVSAEPDLRVPDRIAGERPTPVALAETPAPTANADATPRPSPSPTAQAAVRADGPARPAVAAAAPATTVTPAPSPAGVANTPAPAPPTGPPPATPAPVTPAPATPAPTDPPPVVCSAGAPEFSEHGNQVRVSNGTVVFFDGGSGALLLDVGGTGVPLLVTQFTEVVGDLGGATVVSGQGHRAQDGTIVAQSLEVVC